MYSFIKGLWKLKPYLPTQKRLVAGIALVSLLAALLEGVGIGLLLPVLGLLQDNGPSAMRVSMERHQGGKATITVQPLPSIASAAAAPPLEWDTERQPEVSILLPENRDSGASAVPLRLLNRFLPNANRATYAAILCVFVFVAITMKNLAILMSSRLTARLRRSNTEALRNALFRTLQTAQLEAFESTGSGELANLALLETGRCAYGVEFLSLFGQRAGIALCYLAGLLLISWQMTAMTAVTGTVIGLSLRVLYRRLAASGNSIASSSKAVSGYLIERIAGVRLMRLTRMEDQESMRFAGLNEENARATESGMRTTATVTAMSEIMAVAGSMTVIGCAVAWLVVPGLLRGELVLGYALVLLRLQPVVNQLYGLYGQVAHLSGVPANVSRWLEQPRFPKRPFGAVSFENIRNGIEVRDLTFAYPNGTVALDSVSFRFAAGKVTALVGSSGSGKSTIAGLLMRLREPSSGGIFVDGIDYWRFSPDSWHRAIGFVEQDTFFFNETIINNLTYGIDTPAKERVEEAIRQSYLDDVISGLPSGLDTIIGERGVSLSGGQRQRLAIARALLRDPKLLILDEATSALDSISEQQVQAALNNAQHGRTVVVIAHRLSTIRRADRIIVLEDGKVKEEGTWDQLSGRSGVFARFVDASATSI